jgi:gas vesicle protein
MKKIILATIAGIGIGMLLAPRKGSETVNKLKGRLKDLRDDTADEADEMVNKGKKAFVNGKNRVSEII